ncbi:MAG: hypothetical protein IJG52_05470 [Lachnospiraceae bacterium]|nr:hypothetical protein [Lachnospiraceae bacterium]
MIDFEAARPFHGLGPKEKIRFAAVAAAAAAAVAVTGYYGFFYDGWLTFPGRNNVYFIQHGEMIRDSWIRQGDDYLRTDHRARRVTGLCETDGYTYFFDGDGLMQTGWQDTERGRMYFLEDGTMMQGWIGLDGEEYYFAQDGVMQTGWLDEGGRRYYLGEDGGRKEGWNQVEGLWYYCAQNGQMQTGWIRDGGKWYLLAEDGRMLTGDQEVDGRLYYLNDDGSRYTGWRDREGGRSYYSDRDGYALVGWADVDGSRMYFDENALMRTGRITLGDDSYYLEDDGTVLPGWHEEEVYDEENDETVTETFYVCRDGYILDTDKETGSAGRLVIHDCGIDVRVFKPSSRDDYQKITDEENSALIVKERRDDEPAIADRRSQGFDLAQAGEGKSYAYILDRGGEIQEYLCSSVQLGINNGEDVLDEQQVSIWRQNEGGFCTYSSAGTGNPEEVRIVFWRPVEEDKED